MPGMSGSEVIRACGMMSGSEKVPILVLTGDPSGRDEIDELGANGTVQKPFDLQELVVKIREQLAGGWQPAAGGH